jgi:hypothetical protein
MCVKSVWLGLCRAYASGDHSEAMHSCACLCVLTHEAHGHNDCCKAMYACVRVGVLDCTRCILSAIAARRCMRVWECVLGPVQGACSW